MSDYVKTRGLQALMALSEYRELREAMPQNVRDAAAAGHTQAEIARRSGLSRQWVAKVLADAQSQ